ncbi:aminotransferase class V-fold PLP-dependent enzyme [Candidatus Pelagibacter sp. Uisw_094]|jgi:alanine-glyoxylate transaminase/serine-glyoxylate transaminase/serine-pyruvate transaminase|uniref:pyridoxal-phosphate-dependent aminotransferase family protein n=1 Tax=Candidatus Pelagibacter sp. Uisw_094 TaxID=3230980 RepID=UPI0023135632|nr:aminotransferase class V-fold PLP-dependent enzyme [Candidatus Pelagibacter sp.]
MIKSNSHKAGRHFLQVPGPTNIPDRVLQAMAFPAMDHRGPDFQNLSFNVLKKIKLIFKSEDPVVIFPSAGTGAMEASLANTLSEGDKILMFETGHFATEWCQAARRYRLDVDFIPGDWRTGADPKIVEKKLSEDKNHKIKAVLVTHNETSTGIKSQVEEVRKAIDSTNHPALFMVDTISSLGSYNYDHQKWKVDVTVGGSQKGLMCPPGLSFNAISPKALEAYKKSKITKSYFDWGQMLDNNKNGFYPYTPAVNLLYALNEAVDMLLEEGLESVFKRHKRHADATRIAVEAWGLEILARNPIERSDSITAIMVPDGHDSDNLRKIIYDNYNMSLGTGLNKVKGKVFRIGHMGDLNDLTLAGTLSGVEMGLKKSGIPFNKGGIMAALDFLSK